MIAELVFKVNQLYNPADYQSEIHLNYNKNRSI